MTSIVKCAEAYGTKGNRFQHGSSAAEQHGSITHPIKQLPQRVSIYRQRLDKRLVTQIHMLLFFFSFPLRSVYRSKRQPIYACSSVHSNVTLNKAEQVSACSSPRVECVDCSSSWRNEALYLSLAQSLGAAHSVAQWARWKTKGESKLAIQILSQQGHRNDSVVYPHRSKHVAGIRTLLDAVLLDFTFALLLLDALDAVIEVVLGGCALGGVLALCNLQHVSLSVEALSWYDMRPSQN